MNKRILYLLAIVFAFISMSAVSIAKQRTALVDDIKPKNLKVLPQDISEAELKHIMKFFSNSLGVKCSFCHAPRKDNPEKLDFASDENHYKDVARYMMKMTNGINEQYFHPYPGQDGKMVQPNHINCMTCHNGQKEPVTMPATHPNTSGEH